MNNLQLEGLGVFTQNGSASAFLKKVPSQLEDADLHQYGLNVKAYHISFCRKNFDLPSKMRANLLAKEPSLRMEILQYLETQQENVE